ncbi:hypothetical protein AURDEDRAFT_116033 [Auricularia subglabra TFB-10046 SS5]|nr:hypothetical protein AURDEDRAFT_116033 [Auricularia subglabra TFB-10046 SS5]
MAPPPTVPESPGPASPSRPTSRSSSLSRSPSPVPTTPYPDTESAEDRNAVEFLLAFFKPKTTLLCNRAGQHLDPSIRFDDLLHDLALTALLRAEVKFPEQIAPLLVAATHANSAPTDPKVVKEMKAALKFGEQAILQVLEDPVVIPRAIRRALDDAAAAAGEPRPSAATAPAQARPTTALSHPRSTTAGEPQPPAAMAPAQARPTMTPAHPHPLATTVPAQARPTTAPAHPHPLATTVPAQAAPKPARVRAAPGRASPISAQPGSECARCKQKGLPCKYDKNPRPIQPGAPRTPVACLACRRVKMKCTPSAAPPPQAGTKRVRDAQDSPSPRASPEWEDAGPSRPPKHPRLAEPSAASGSLREDRGVGSLSRAAFWDPPRSSRYVDPIVMLSEWVEFVDSLAQELESDSRRRVW